jgi:hypothetical protein
MFALIITSRILAQEFKTLPEDFSPKARPLEFRNILPSAKGSVLLATTMGLAEIDGLEIHIPYIAGNLTDEKGKKQYLGKNSNILKDVFESFVGVKLLCEGPDNMIYVVTDNNNLGWINYKWSRAIGHPPINFQNHEGRRKIISKIWIDSEGCLYIVTNVGTYIVPEATRLYNHNTNNKKVLFETGLDEDSNYVVTEGERPVTELRLPAGVMPYSFAEDPNNKKHIFIGTNFGLFGYDKRTGQSVNYFKDNPHGAITITQLYTSNLGDVLWFSTSTRGMGRFTFLNNRIFFYKYPKKNENAHTDYSISSFSRKSANEFFVAIADSLPAIFDCETGLYTYINDSIFYKSENKTTDIKADSYGNLYITKGGKLYWSKTWVAKSSQFAYVDSSLIGPYIRDIEVNGTPYNFEGSFYGGIETLQKLQLEYNQNNINILYASRGIDPDSLQYAWKMDNYNSEWFIIPYSILNDEMNMAGFSNLRPGAYVFHAKAGKINGEWIPKQIRLAILIKPPFWQTWWFPALVIAVIGLIVFTLVQWRVNRIKRQQEKKTRYERELLELEAKALRAQMNPHFIFNCMNSIKSLILQKNEDKAVNYLTTFSKLLRTILQNSDKREITLYDEIETCRLYTQLESMRFDKKFNCHFNIDETIDLKSIRISALIIQPFIENAIWHGIVPKEGEGSINISVKFDQNLIKCIIDDDGIGREISKQNKFKRESSTHRSKGVRLTQTRLDLDNILNQRNAQVEIFDKKDLNGNATGCTVVLTFTEY